MKRSAAYALTFVCALAVGLSPAAVASSPGGTATHISGSFEYADGAGQDPATGLSVDVQVQVGTTTFRSHSLPGGTLTVNTNVLSASFDAPTPDGFGFGFGCWIIPATDFVINSDLSASLTFDSSDPRVTECPGDPIGPSGLTSAGLVSGLSGPIHLNLNWAPTSPILNSQITTRESCHPYFDLQTGSSQGVSANPSGTADGAFTDPADSFGGNLEGEFGSVNLGNSQFQFTGFPGICGPGP